MTDTILAILKERGMHTLNLYRATKFTGTFQAFQLLLNQGLQDGHWQMKDGYWHIKSQPELLTQLPMAVEVDYLINTSKQFTDPSEKHPPTLESFGFYRHENYESRQKSVGEMLADNMDGYQIVPGKFVRDEQGKIKQKASWQKQQIFMVEFDDDVPYNSLKEVVEHDTFVRENAVALVESIRSCYNDPNDDTCNGELRYRAFFLMPQPVVNTAPADFLIKRLLAECPGACESGSTLTNGAFGLRGARSHLLNNYVQADYIQAWNEAWQVETEKAQRYTFSNAVNISELSHEYKEAINQLTYGADNWSKRMLPCSFSNHEHDGWNSRGNAMGVFRHSDGQGYTLHCFKCDGKRTYRVKGRRGGRRRVKHISDSEAVYQSLETAQVDNENLWDMVTAPQAFSKNRQAFLIQSDTGVGKDYAMLLEASRNDVFSLNPHSGLSQQIHERAEQRGLSSYHIRNRMHGFEKIAELPIAERIKVFKRDPNVMCVHADRCDALINRIGDCKEVLCNSEHCEVYDFCSQHRYVSQIRKAASCQVAHYSWVQLPTDPGSKGIVARIMDERKKQEKHKPIWVVGEVDTHKLLNRHTISADEIQQGVEIWGGEPAGQLYRKLSELCMPHLSANERFSMLQETFEKLDRTKARKQLSRMCLKGLAHQEEITVSHALKEGLGSIENVESIHNLPRLYPDQWTLVERLEQFLTYCVSAHPPITFLDNQLEFVTPPVLNSMVDLYVMQSATADEYQIKNLLTSTSDDLDFYVGAAERVEHHPETRIFKIATGRYVRSSCFSYSKGYQNVIGLRETIRPHLESLLWTLRNTPGNKFVNTYKVLYEGDELADDELIQALRAEPNVQWSNWASAFGLDIEADTVLIEFGTNEPSEDILKAACAEAYIGDTDPFSFEFDNWHEHDGIRIEGIRTYKDYRVQAVYEGMTDRSQYQIANRTRPVRNAATVLIYSSHPCKWLDNRVEWITPDMLGGDLRNLEIPEPKSAFQAERDEKVALAVELAKEGMNNREIAVQLGYKSARNVGYLLKGKDV